MDNSLAPLTDLHRHLEGCIRPQTALELASRHGLPVSAGDLDSFQRALWLTEPTPDILLILPKFDLLRNVLVDYDVCRRVTLECLEDAEAEGLDYIEIRFSPLFMAEPHALQPESVTAAVCEAWQEARIRQKMESRLIVILSRTYGAEACQIELECALACRDRGIVAIDLAGDELRHPAAEFANLFLWAKDAGLHRTAHAGEFARAESIRQTVELLDAERIGHGVHAVDDPAVMELLAERKITVECCPTSNYLTCSVASMSEHPLPQFLRAGIRAALCADDPALMSGITIWDEYRLAREEMGLSEGELLRVRQNGWEGRFGR